MIYDFLLNAAADIAKKRSASGFTPNPDDTICVLYTNTGNIYTGVSSINSNGIIHAEMDAVNSMRSHGESIIQAIAVLNSYTLSPILPCNGYINFIISVNNENARCMIVIPNGNIRITEVGAFIASMNQHKTIQPANPNMRYVQNTPNYTYMPNQAGNFPGQARANMANSYHPGYSQMPGSSQITYTSGQPAAANTKPVSPQPVINTQPPAPTQPVENVQPTSSMFSPNANRKAGGDYLRNKVNNLLGDDDDDNVEEEEKEKKKNKKRFGGLFK